MRNLGPVLLALALTSIPIVQARTVHAGETAPDESLSDAARDLYRKATGHYERGEYEKARRLFLSAWSLKKHYSIAANLGDCEVRLRRYRDAAEHLSHALRNYPEDAPESERKGMELLLQKAAAQVGTVRVEAREFAEVFVDGQRVGTAPLTGALFVEPGKHTIEARWKGKELGRATVDVKPGDVDDVHLSPRSSASGPGSAATGDPKSPGEREAGSVDGPDTWPIVVGAGVGAVGLGIGVGFLIAAESKESERDDMVAALGGGHVCDGTSNLAECAEIERAVSSAQNRATISTVGFVVGGAATVATVVYILWPREKTTAARSTITPTFGKQGGGLVLTHSF